MKTRIIYLLIALLCICILHAEGNNEQLQFSSRSIKRGSKATLPTVTINVGDVTTSNGASLFINGGELVVNTSHGCNSDNTASCPASTDTDFYGPEGSNDALTINPSSNMGSTNVKNYSGTQHPDAPYAIDHYWEINATTDQTCDIDFRMRDGDIPGGVTLSDLRPWEWNGSTWTQLTATYSSSSSSGGFTTVSFTGVDLTGAKSNNVITLNEDGEDPLPVALSSFTVNVINTIPVMTWMTYSEQNNAGWNIYRSISENLGQSIKINTEMIDGAGSSNEPTEYTFEDEVAYELNMTYYYWLESVSFTGETEVFGPTQILIGNEQDNPNAPEIAKNYGLYQNYPNPFNPTTEISFMLKEDSKVELLIYNLKGQLVKKLYEGNVTGKEVQNFVWNGRDDYEKEVSTGIYFYILKTKNNTLRKSMLLIK